MIVMKMGVYKACSDYLIENFMHTNLGVSSWKVTDKSLVVYDFDRKRHVIPLKSVPNACKDVPIMKRELEL